jgi:hypothetical protein
LQLRAAPEHLRIAAVVFAMASVVLLALAARQWSAPPSERGSEASFLGLMTLLRPWWFWENYRARWLRNLIGDEATMLVYLGIAAIMVWVGLNTDWTFGRR